MICGIDVGLKGAIALLYPSGPSYVYDMPVIQKEINGAVLSGMWRYKGSDRSPANSVHSSQSCPLEKTLQTGTRQGRKPRRGNEIIPRPGVRICEKER